MGSSKIFVGLAGWFCKACILSILQEMDAFPKATSKRSQVVKSSKVMRSQSIEKKN